MVEQGDCAFTVYETDRVPGEVLSQVKAVFAENYRDANIGYLEKNLGKLRFLSIARDPTGTTAGFSLGEARVMDLPRLPRATVNLAGLCCVSGPFRRHGLFGKLEGLCREASQVPSAERMLSCGRTAHPASFRGMARNPSGVPKRGHRPTEWQKEVGIAVAEAYGSPGFDAETFVVKGSGTPIGWPVIEIEATPEEWELFAPVDRAKGDSLLGIAWNPTPPEGWVEHGRVSESRP
jgi:hypothetical protein